MFINFFKLIFCNEQNKIKQMLPTQIIRLSGVILFSLISISSYAKPLLDIQHWQTNNGAQVYFVQTPEVPMVEINVVFAAGSGRDGQQLGIAQFTNQMLNQGTPTLTADQIGASFDNVGAQFSNVATRDMSIISLQSLSDPKYLTPALQTFADVLTTSSFPQDAFLRTQQQTLNDIAQQSQTPNTVAKNTFFASLYNNQPYGHPVVGNISTVSALTVNDLQNFYKQYYVGKNAIITIVGAISKDQAGTIANQIMGNLPAGEAAAALPAAPPLTQAAQQNIKFPSEQTNIFMGQVGINYNNPIYFPLFVGNYLLGGSGLTSLIFTEVREKRGLAYSAGSSFAPLAANGPFYIILQSRNDQANKALQVVRDTLNNFIQKGPDENQLATTKRNIINGFPLTLVGSDAISSALLIIGFYHLPLDYLDTYVAKINAVTVDQVKQVFQQNIHPNRMVTVTVGNAS